MPIKHTQRTINDTISNINPFNKKQNQFIIINIFYNLKIPIDHSGIFAVLNK
jgi:hypothetical protein